MGNAGLSTLAHLDPANASLVESAIALRAVPGAVASGSDAIWIAGREDDVILRVSPSTNSSVSQTIPVCDQPVSIAVDGAALWVGCAGAEEAVWRLADDGSVFAKIKVGGVPSDIAVGDGRVYVSVRQQ